jgi:hypothetical protein
MKANDLLPRLRADPQLGRFWAFAGKIRSWPMKWHERGEVIRD